MVLKNLGGTDSAKSGRHAPPQPPPLGRKRQAKCLNDEAKRVSVTYSGNCNWEQVPQWEDRDGRERQKSMDHIRRCSELQPRGRRVHLGRRANWEQSRAEKNP